MVSLRGLLEEWGARRRGRRHSTNPIGRAARDIAGPTGWVVSPTWDQLDRHGTTYVDSFDRRLPPSTFVSERDRQRANLPIPVAERCLEDWRPPDRRIPPAGRATKGHRVR